MRILSFYTLITEDEFLIEMSGNNPVATQFDVSSITLDDWLGPSIYVIKYTVYQSLWQDLVSLEQQFPDPRFVNLPGSTLFFEIVFSTILRQQ